MLHSKHCDKSSQELDSYFTIWDVIKLWIKVQSKKIFNSINKSYIRALITDGQFLHEIPKHRNQVYTVDVVQVRTLMHTDPFALMLRKAKMLYFLNNFGEI